METILNYESGNKIKGHLEVIKLYADGTEEVHFSDKNVITSGMGHTLLKAFATSGSGSIDPFQIVYFQLGTSGHAGIQVSSTGSLSASLSNSDYGTANFQISTHDLSSGTPAASQPFGIIPWPYIKKVSPTRVMYQILVGDEAVDGITINEIGLFSKNPNISTPEGSYLCAYRYFTALAKQDSFSVLFRWTIEF
jgi:hypothetical protein